MRGVSKTFTTYSEASVIPDVLWRKVRHLDIVASGKIDLFKLVTGKYGGRIMAIRKIPDWRPPILLSETCEHRYGGHSIAFREMRFSDGKLWVGRAVWDKATVRKSLRLRRGSFLCGGHRYWWKLAWSGLVVRYESVPMMEPQSSDLGDGVLKLSWIGVFKLWRWARA